VALPNHLFECIVHTTDGPTVPYSLGFTSRTLRCTLEQGSLQGKGTAGGSHRDFAR
jgi:hypothetical protein